MSIFFYHLNNIDSIPVLTNHKAFIQSTVGTLFVIFYRYWEQKYAVNIIKEKFIINKCRSSSHQTGDGLRIQRVTITFDPVGVVREDLSPRSRTYGMAGP